MSACRSAPGWARAADVLRIYQSLGEVLPDRVLVSVRSNAAVGHLATWAAGLRYADARKDVKEDLGSGLLPAEVWMDESVQLDWLTGGLTGATALQCWQANGVQFSLPDLESLLGLNLTLHGQECNETEQCSSTAAIRANAWKNGRPPSDEEICAKADEMKARGVTNARLIARDMH
ncbi:MAG: hypothetical protein ABIT04_12755 [Novosphingobium sp.]